jgi:hypothetical protein
MEKINKKLLEALVKASACAPEVVEMQLSHTIKTSGEVAEYWIAFRVLSKLCVHCGAMRGLGYMRIFVLGNTLSFDAQGRFVELYK